MPFPSPSISPAFGALEAMRKAQQIFPQQTPTYAAMAPQPAPQHGGMFGGLRAAFTGERGAQTLRGIAAALRDLDTGGNSLPELLAQMEEQRRNMDREAFQRWQMDHARMQAAQEDKTQAQTSAAIDALPEAQRPWARLAPDAVARRMLAPPEQPDWQIDAQGRPYAIQDGRVQYGEGRVAVPPRGGGGAVINMPQTAISRLAEQYVTTGVLPPGISRNPRLAAQVYAEADALAAAQGLTAQDQSWRGANYQANSQGLRALQRQRTSIQAFERTALRNLQLVQRLSRQVPRSDYPLVNRALMTGQRQTGNTAVAQYVNALIGARTEYAKVLSGATGAAGLTDSARAEAEEMFSTYATPDQIDALIDVARQEMHNRLNAFDDQESYLREQMTPGSSRRDNPAETGGVDSGQGDGPGTGIGAMVGASAQPPAGISPDDWQYLTPEERQRVLDLQ